MIQFHTNFFSVMTCAAALLFLGGCRTSRVCQSDVARSDSVRHDTREKVIIRERTEFVHDTAYVDIPRQTAERTATDSVSRLENDFAVSTVWLNHDGSLRHLLETKPGKQAVSYPRRIEYHDSIQYRDSIVYKYKYYRVTNKVSVPRKIRWWEWTCIFGFCGVVIFVAIKYSRKIYKAAVRVFRKK